MGFFHYIGKRSGSPEKEVGVTKIRLTLIISLTIVALFALYRFIFIRTVNYDIGGVKIPSQYNILTGKARPIEDYRGTGNLPTVESRNMKNAGLTEKETAGAQIRWAVFEEWVKTKPEYNGWESDPTLFSRAQEDFKKNVEPRTRAIVIK